MRQLHYLLLFLFCGLTSTHLSAQTGHYTFEHIGIEDGLSNSFILWSVEDSHGAVWFYTEAGINRITGNGVTTIVCDSAIMPDYGASCLYYDHRTDHVWVFTYGAGVARIDCRTLQITPHPEQAQFCRRSMTFAADAADGGQWLAYSGGNIQHRSPDGRYTLYAQQDIPGLDNHLIRFLLDDGQGHLYICYNNGGLSVLDIERRTARHYLHDAADPSSLPGDNVRYLAFDAFHNLWVATNKGLALFDPQQGTFLLCCRQNGFPLDISGDNIQQLCPMRDGTLWCSCEPGGITILDLRDFALRQPSSVRMRVLLPSNSSLSSPSPRSILQDRFGNVWIGLYDAGVDVITSQHSSFHLLPAPSPQYSGRVSSSVAGVPAQGMVIEESMPLRHAYGIAADSEQRLWIGASNLLYCYQADSCVGQWSILPHIDRPFAKIYCVYCDHLDRVWMGIDDVGVLMYDSRTARFQSIGLDAPYLDVRSFFEDDEGHLWIGSEQGVYLYDEASGRGIYQDSIVPRNFVIFAFQQDRLGRLWVGTFGSGIYIYDRQLHLVAELNTTCGLSNDNVNQIFRDIDGALWIATRGGLCYVPDPAEPTRLQVIGRADGLTDDHIRAVCQDQLGQIWFSTHTTLSCYNHSQHTIRNYDYHDGLPHGGFVESSTCILPDGTLCFASSDGIACFNPRLVTEGRSITPVQITREDVDDSYYRIDFAVADYSQRLKADYSYRLLGLDDDWHSTLGDPYVTFRNLAPGHYTFQVRARLRNGEWDDASLASTTFTIDPPLWRTWWALTLYAILALGIVTLILYYYLRKVRLEAVLRMEKKQRQDVQELNNERMRFYTNITHELRTPLTLILGPLEDLVADSRLPAPYHHRIETIQQSAQRLLGLINQILEFRKTETQNRRLIVRRGDLRPVVREVGLRYEELNHNRQVHVRVDVPDAFPLLYFDSEVVVTILNNLLSNALKYTAQGEVCLRLSQADGKALISVSDTGYGIPAAALPHIFDRYYQAGTEHQASGSGIGLAIVRSLVELHQGQVAVESQEGQGSRFTFSIDLDCTYPDALHGEPAAHTSVPSSQSLSPLRAVGTASQADTRPVLLVVEDNDDIRQYILESFDLDYQVLTAVNGREGLLKAQQHIPDIIVSDIMMPVMDGIELCQSVKGDVTTSHIPVILLTAKDTLDDKTAGYDSGADSYLTKPFSAKLLHSRIQNLLTARARLAQLLTQPLSDSSAQSVTAATACDTTAGVSGMEMPAAQLTPLDRQFLERLHTLIDQNLASDLLDINYLTTHLNMSASTLYRKVKALTDLSPNEYIRHRRLLRACDLLLGGEHNVNETAYLTGFSTPNYFRDCFKAEFGITPSEFQREQKPRS